MLYSIGLLLFSDKINTDSHKCLITCKDRAVTEALYWHKIKCLH